MRGASVAWAADKRARSERRGRGQSKSQAGKDASRSWPKNQYSAKHFFYYTKMSTRSECTLGNSLHGMMEYIYRSQLCRLLNGTKTSAGLSGQNICFWLKNPLSSTRVYASPVNKTTDLKCHANKLVLVTSTHETQTSSVSEVLGHILTLK